MGLGFYRVHKCLLNFTILLVVTFLKITSSDVSIGMVKIFRFNHLIFLYFPYAIFKVQCNIKNRIVWNACIPKRIMF